MAARAKAVTARIKLVIQAGQAKPSPPVGPALGQAGLKIMDFCKEFNARTADLRDDVPVPVVVTAYEDKSFTWEMRTPPASYFIKKAAGVAAGAGKPGHQTAGEVSLKHLYEIALVKRRDAPHVPLASVVASLMGTCRAMGVKVVAAPPPPAAGGGGGAAAAADDGGGGDKG